MTHLDTLSTEQILTNALRIKKELAYKKAELDLLTAKLAERALNTPGKHVVGTVGSYTVSENNTYDQTVITANLSPGQIRRCTVPKLDNSVVAKLYPQAYAAAKKNNGVKVSIG